MFCSRKSIGSAETNTEQGKHHFDHARVDQVRERANIQPDSVSGVQSINHGSVDRGLLWSVCVVIVVEMLVVVVVVAYISNMDITMHLYRLQAIDSESISEEQ